MSSRAFEWFVQSLYEGADDQYLAEYAVDHCWRELPQPESLDRFVRAARLQPGLWGAAAANAVHQLLGVRVDTRWPRRGVQELQR